MQVKLAGTRTSHLCDEGWGNCIVRLTDNLNGEMSQRSESKYDCEVTDYETLNLWNMATEAEDERLKVCSLAIDL
jgi:hypothetical protein